jgi:hypothetical protein
MNGKIEKIGKSAGNVMFYLPTRREVLLAKSYIK